MQLPASLAPFRFRSAQWLIFFGAAAWLAVTAAMPSDAQTAASKPEDVEVAAVLSRVTAVQAAFVERVHAAGFTCPIAVPKILVEDIPSFGNYDEKTNIVHTSAWVLLKPEEKTLFLQLAGPGGNEASAREIFEAAAHGWIFVHEMGHWWQACTKTSAKLLPYPMEYGADRISLAYWREADPKVVATMMPIFQGVIDHGPNPVPAGEDVEAYFNKHYEELGPSPAYPWFQSRMNIAAYEEKPAPTFAQVLREAEK